MLLSSNKSIEDRIVEHLGHGPETPKKLWSQINTTEPTSIQAVYKALKKLEKDEIVLKAKHKITLSEEWVEKVGRLLIKDTPYIQLEDGEVITYKFKGLSELDRHWKHVVKNFIKTLKGPVFHSEPHEMWIHIADRYESQIDYINSFAKDKRYCYLIFGGTTAMDKEYKRQHQNDFLSVNLEDKPTFIKRNEFLTIIEETIITTIINDELGSKIDALYDSTKDIDPNFGKRVEELFIHTGPVKLRIELNGNKARLLRKKLSKNFFIPQELIAEYNLF